MRSITGRTLVKTLLADCPNQYDPPYDSPIENDFAWNITKYLDDEAVRFEKQVWAETHGGNFRLDFKATVGGRKVGIECDGAQFHDFADDERRDAAILGAGCCDVIYRFEGKDIVYHIEDALFLLSILEPALFSERGKRNLEVLASEAARNHRGLTVLYTHDEAGEELNAPFLMLIQRRARERAERQTQ